MLYDIDIRELNLGPFRNLKVLDEISLKKCVVFTFLSNKCIIISSFQEKNTTISNKRRFIDGDCIILFYFILLVMFHEPQTWGPMAVEWLQFIHCMYINFIQSFSSNCWIKINFDSKWTLKPKMLSCNFFKKLLMFRIAKKIPSRF